ncbi:response regulator receiver domain protein [Ostertagia ostertagi]
MRDGLEAFLSREFDIRCFASAKAFLAARGSVARPHCILLDLRMPEMDGLALQEALRSSAPLPPIIFMSGDADKSDIIEAWRGGAANFILKPFSADEIRESIQALWERATIVAPTHNPDLPITRREAQVLLLLGQGLQQSEAAEKLGLSLRTIKMYRPKICLADRDNTSLQPSSTMQHRRDPLACLRDEQIIDDASKYVEVCNRHLSKIPSGPWIKCSQPFHRLQRQVK